MGSQSVKAITSQKERKEFISHLLNDVKAFEKMITDDTFEKGIQRIGAEQELCIVNESYRPSLNALKILDEIDDPHFTTELALFNLEINLDPVELSNKCFSNLEKDLTQLLYKAQIAADKIEANKIILSGILPTLKKKDLIFENMTPHERYKTLNDVIKNIRGDNFKMRIRGIDELILNHESILFEACNTSFQVHLQIELDEIIDKYNWSQAIAGPILSVMSNSPMLMGRELWCETRIALFQQSIDMRNTSHLLREQKPRVSFGNDWVRESIVELFTDDISRYIPLVTTNFKENSLDLLNKGIMPKLEALNLHNGTLYKWNRLCYGTNNNIAHLRIENRYIPSGPSVKDEIANALFWIGVMQGMPNKYKQIWKQMPFNDARGNFINAARTGINTYFNWFGSGISAIKLAKRILIPMAREGLNKSNIDVNDIDFYLNIIEKRIDNNLTGSKWQIRSNRKLRKKVSRDEANILLTYNMYKNQRDNKPIYQWKLAEHSANSNIKTSNKLYKFMTTELFVVNENDLVELLTNIMDWKNIHHLPVVNELNKITGIITKTNLDVIDSKSITSNLIVAKDIMIKDVKIADSEMTIDEARKIMNTHKIGCLPIVDNDELIGMFTKKDLEKIDKKATVNE
jgi:CBS domain-containing protein